MVLIAALDDFPIVLRGVADTLSRQLPDVELLGMAETVAGLLALVDSAERKPDLVLVDLHLADGVMPYDAITRLAQQGIPSVVFTSELRPIPLRLAIAAGAGGIALKSDPIDSLVAVIEDVLAGNVAASSDLAFVLLSDPQLTARLAPRELEVLSLIAEGVPRKSIGKRLDPPISTTTVVTYVNRVCHRYRELGRDVASVYDAIRAAQEDGYL